MDLRLFFHHMRPSHALSVYAERKLAVLAEKFGASLLGVQMTMEAPEAGFKASALVHGPGYTTSFDALDQISMKGAIDQLEAKIDGALARRKDRRLASRRAEIAARKERAQKAPGGDAAAPEAIDAADVIALDRARRRRATPPHLSH